MYLFKTMYLCMYALFFYTYKYHLCMYINGMYIPFKMVSYTKQPLLVGYLFSGGINASWVSHSSSYLDPSMTYSPLELSQCIPK